MVVTVLHVSRSTDGHEMTSFPARQGYGMRGLNALSGDTWGHLPEDIYPMNSAVMLSARGLWIRCVKKLWRPEHSHSALTCLNPVSSFQPAPEIDRKGCRVTVPFIDGLHGVRNACGACFYRTASSSPCLSDSLSFPVRACRRERCKRFQGKVFDRG